MNFSAAVSHAQQSIPQSITTTLNWAAAATGIASFLTTWVPIVVGLLSGFWIACQVWMFFYKKPWRRK